MFDREYKGKVVLFGESVMYKDVTALKGEAVYKRGVWVGKSFWSDSHIVLTPKGAVESRSIRRLTTQFSADDLVMAKGLPWSFSRQEILMKMKAPTTRRADGVEEAEENAEEKAKQAGVAVALGLVTPGVMGGLSTPIPLAGPQTPVPAPGTPSTSTIPNPSPVPNPGGAASSSREGDGTMRAEPQEDRGEGVVRKHDDEAPEASPKRARTLEDDLDLELEMGDFERKRDRDDQPQLEGASPKRMRRVLAEFPDGDDAYEDDIIMEEAEKFFERGDLENEGDDKPPVVSEDEMRKMDDEAEKEEERRLIKMGVLHEVAEDESVAEDAYTITTKMVITWKHREEQGGWFRRARLVARQYKWSVFTDDAFAPTSAYALVRLMIHLAINADMSMWTVDVKDAFLMVPQPSDENAYVTRGGKVFKLGRVLPGQRTAASQWFKEFKTKAEKYGMECDSMQPSLMRLKEDPHQPGKRLYITIHVDDLFVVGDENEAKKFFKNLEEKEGWKLEKKGPFKDMDRFDYLKRKMEIVENGCEIRADDSHIRELAKLSGTEKRSYKLTPCASDFNKLSKEDEKMPEEHWLTFRSCVGKLLYLSPDRPDIQFVVQGLAVFMKEPTKKAWKAVQHLCMYLSGTSYEGILLKKSVKGTSVLNVDGVVRNENDMRHHVMEVVCDADHAGNRATRKSLSSVHIYLDGNLMESYVRCQKSIALSSGESEYVCMVGGCSEGLFLKHCWGFMSGEDCMLVCRSDSSAARSLAGRLGIGRARHIEANLLWLQQKVAEKSLTITPIPTELNPADIGTKYMPKVRLNGLKYMIKMVDYGSHRIGIHEYKELEAKEQLRKDMQKFPKKGGFTGRVAMIIALSLMRQSEGRKIQEDISVVKFDFSEKLAGGRAEMSPLFLCVALLAVVGALSLAMVFWFCGVRLVKVSQKMLAFKLSKENDEMKKEKEKIEVENDNLKKINSLLKDENEKLKKWIEDAKRADDTRRALVTEMEGGKLSALQVENVIKSLEKIELWVTRAGEAYHVASCRFTKPPHSNTALKYRACGECYAGSVRAVLSRSV